MSMLSSFLPLLFLFSNPTAASSSCFPHITSGQILWDLSQTSHQSPHIWPLMSERDGRLVGSRIQLVGERIGKSAVLLKVRFDPEFNGVSLPYNVYAVMAVADGKVVYWHDFTQACQAPGLSFFPGREVELPLVKLDDGGGDRLQIMVWGKL